MGPLPRVLNRGGCYLCNAEVGDTSTSHSVSRVVPILTCCSRQGEASPKRLTEMVLAENQKQKIQSPNWQDLCVYCFENSAGIGLR